MAGAPDTPEHGAAASSTAAPAQPRRSGRSSTASPAAPPRRGYAGALGAEVAADPCNQPKKRAWDREALSHGIAALLADDSG
jgi:hypothetical protein